MKKEGNYSNFDTSGGWDSTTPMKINIKKTTQWIIIPTKKYNIIKNQSKLQMPIEINVSKKFKEK